MLTASAENQGGTEMSEAWTEMKLLPKLALKY
jgi:hypothetical protein